MTKYCFSSSNNYLDYSCHRKLNEYFSRNDIFKDIEYKAKNFLENITADKGYSANEKNIFNKLYHFLKGDGIFWDQDNTECCKYINYWLNTSLQDLLPGLRNTDSFKVFQNIVDFYNEDKSSKRCVSDIKYIESNELNKMFNLYSLYKNYEALTAKLKGHGYNSCDILTKMHLNFNYALTSSANEDNNLFSRLEELKKLIDDIPQKEKNGCPSYIHFKDPESIKKTKSTESEQHTGTHDQKKITKGLSPPEPQSLPPEPESPAPDLDSQSAPVLQDELSELQDPQFRGIPSTSRSNELSRLALEETYSGLSQNTYNRNSERQRLQSGSDHSRGLTYSDELGNSFILGNVGSENLGRNTSDDGFLGKVQGAFSSIAEHVEPAPILGVSGGMGVLFLLFKYTPVGSFFGARRGRFHQIPRSFNGPFPGDFANFQEYDGGFIGYRPMNPLAE
ncbi:unnamed protein product [Plasmodium vivax]|uniref:(malaria parasite P. vivax) hypothetical protein n=1 Tax=Plasmodium vivax TaxID=5855 RepID=A0A8S4H286_PLAVI|nr:unnamed protein product [Plasmodium vivax]